MNEPKQGGSVERLTDALVSWAGSGTLLISHMSRNVHPDGDPIPEVLHRLIGGTLEPLADRHAATDLAAAVQVIEDALDTIGEEIYLVEPGSGSEF